MSRPHRQRLAASLLAGGALAVLAFTSCSEHTDPMDPGGGEVVEIELVDFAFVDDDVTVEAGTTIRWVNTTSTFHTVTPDGHSAWTEWQTNTEGQTFEVTLGQAGTYEYYCDPHRGDGMTGRIVVTE